jgi:hypothetical protein
LLSARAAQEIPEFLRQPFSCLPEISVLSILLGNPLC